MDNSYQWYRTVDTVDNYQGKKIKNFWLKNLLLML
jgi:hypothetical protein